MRALFARCVDCDRLLLDGQPCGCSCGPRAHDTGSRTEADAAAWAAAHAPDDDERPTRWDVL